MSDPNHNQNRAPMATSEKGPLAESEVEEVLKRAVELHKAGQLREAEQLYNNVIAREPRQATAIHLLGVIAHQTGHNESAVDLISKALSITPEMAAAENNLGLSLRDLGRLEEACQSYQRAIILSPDDSTAHFNNGIALSELGRLEESVISYQTAARLDRKNVSIHLNLGNTYHALKRPEDAVRSYQRALAIQPNNEVAQINLGMLFQEMGQLKRALSVFETSSSKRAFYNRLRCLLACGEYDLFFELIESNMETCRTDLATAAASTFFSHQLGRANPHPFCKNPLDFVRVDENLGEVRDGNIVPDMSAYAQTLNAVWEPLGKTTKSGFQTRDNIFEKPDGPMESLQRILRRKIAEYHDEFQGEECDFIAQFPKDGVLNGWVVRLVAGGHQTEHIHPDGWLSGVFYLQVPQVVDREEGSIELGYWGHEYPILDETYPKRRYYPKTGALILFPSSLFHKTIPFHSQEERVSVAFDFLPSQAH